MSPVLNQAVGQSSGRPAPGRVVVGRPRTQAGRALRVAHSARRPTGWDSFAEPAADLLTNASGECRPSHDVESAYPRRRPAGFRAGRRGGGGARRSTGEVSVMPPQPWDDSSRTCFAKRDVIGARHWRGRRRACPSCSRDPTRSDPRVEHARRDAHPDRRHARRPGELSPARTFSEDRALRSRKRPG